MIAAVTGVILALYVVLHVLGNLKTFQGLGNGEAPVDKYAEWLRTMGGPAIPREGLLWSVRVVLILALLIHIVVVAQLAARNYGARPAGARVAPRLRRSLAASTMLFTGVAILAFVVFHVLHFTTRTIDPTPLAAGTVYANMHGAFQEWYLVAIYAAASALLGFHLWHALWSMVQTAGWDKPNRNPTIRRSASVVAVLVALGFASVPVAFWIDILPEPEGSRVVSEPERDRVASAEAR